MSPNEFQLRAALRDGEGDRVDPDLVIAQARGMQQARHDRRVRYGSVAAVVAVVGGIGVIGGITLQDGGHAKSGSAAGAKRPASIHNGAKSVPTELPDESIAPGPKRDARAVRCPSTAPSLALPGGGGSGQFGAHESLFSGPVEAVKVCVYSGDGSATGGTPPSTELTGQNATELATSLDSAATTRPQSSDCPSQTAPETRTLVVIGISTAGQAMRPVVVTLTCPGLATNGTAIRYGWTPPARLAEQLPQLGANTGPTGKVSGSPIRS